MSSAICFNLDQSKTLLFGKELIRVFHKKKSAKSEAYLYDFVLLTSVKMACRHTCAMLVYGFYGNSVNVCDIACYISFGQCISGGDCMCSHTCISLHEFF